MNGNRFHHSGHIVIGAPLGPICAVTPVAVPGHTPHVVVNFIGGGRLELDPEAATELARRIPESLASLPADCSGFVWGGEPE